MIITIITIMIMMIIIIIIIIAFKGIIRDFLRVSRGTKGQLSYIV